MASGMDIDDECFAAYRKLQGKGGHRGIIFRITDDNKKIAIKEYIEKGTGNPEEEFNNFANHVKQYDCCYAVYDAEYVSKTGSKQAKLCFIIWSNDNAKTKPKMLYASSKDVLRKPLQGIAGDLQACDEGDLCWSDLLEKMEKFKS